jgi:hypothetical protein
MLKSIRLSPKGRFDGRQVGRSAMTLVELLAATILAALLMAAVLGVLKAITREEKALKGNTTGENWEAQFVRQLEWDLANSRTVTVTPTGFQLVGFAGRDFASGAPLHCRTSIEYAVHNLRGGSVLVRNEAHLDSPDLDNQSLELVCNRIERIVLAAAEAGVRAPNAKTATGKTADDASIPDQPVITLYAMGQEKPILQHAFVLR